METMTTASILEQNFHLALSHLVGEHVAVKTRGGTVWRGLFYSLDTKNTSSATSDQRRKDGIGVILKYAVKTDSFEPMDFQRSVQFVHHQAREQATKASPKNVLTIAPEDFVEMRADEVNVNGERIENLDSRTKFKTDTEIGTYHGEDVRQLKAVDSSWLQADTNASLQGLEDTNARGWDQFQTNEKLFGVKATFDESQYTTELRKDKFSREKLQWAELQAAEIEGSGSSNIHIAEERNQARDQGLDEETLYSGVSRRERGSSTSKPSFADVLKAQQKELAKGTEASKTKADMAESWRTAPNAQEQQDNKMINTVAKVTQTATNASASATTSTSESKLEPSMQEAATSTSTSSTATTSVAPKKPKGSLASRLNPAAKEFKVNPDAPEFIPSSQSTPQFQQPVMPTQPAYVPPNNSPSFVPQSAPNARVPPPQQFHPNYSRQMNVPQSAPPPLPMSQPPSMGYSTMSMGYPAMYAGMVSNSQPYMAGRPQVTTAADPAQYTMGGYPNQGPAYGYGGPFQYQQAQSQYYGAPTSMGYTSYGYNYHQYPAHGVAPSPAMPDPNKNQQHGAHMHWNQGS